MTYTDAQILHASAQFAMELHRDQMRKGNPIQHYYHSFEVTKQAAVVYGIEDVVWLCAYNLHDVAEDTMQYLSLQERLDAITTYMAEFVGLQRAQHITSIVEEMTRKEGDEVSKQVKLDFLRTFETKSMGSIVGKISDRFCNVHDYLAAGRIKYAAWYAYQALPLYLAFRKRRSEQAEYAERVEKDIEILGNLINYHYSIGSIFTMEEDAEFEDIVLNKAPRD